ncbi:helix-turn-helix transcriptional regulator [Leuconostoc suionicum]|uniref:helix-turn-helix transcriptional regulator n=1 Tax=Leuconostoc suionicum TaxID=1511761 RepID=UPI0024ACF62B|nr:helix-turn-helix transcriptional regulator [Leuconostoc suionicum]MDI6551878.1 helix-turn-helix transcriptional regulator [Leuconostoc suionicum]
MKIIFSDNLLALRKEKKLSQEELGNDLFVTRQSISKWESGEVTPDLNKIQMIADYFNIPVEELLFGKDIYNLKSTINVEIFNDHQWNNFVRWCFIGAMIILLLSPYAWILFQ